MIELTIYKAADSKVVPIHITIDEPMPSEGSLNVHPLEARFDLDAQVLAEHLIKTLPGGTLDRLISKLLEMTVSNLIVHKRR